MGKICYKCLHLHCSFITVDKLTLDRDILTYDFSNVRERMSLSAINKS